MTAFGYYIKILNSSKLFKTNREHLVENILREGGLSYEKEINSASLIKWADKKVPVNICGYFVNGKINENRIIKFYKRWIDNDWKSLQILFSQDINNNMVDCITDDSNTFYSSLTNQLIISLGFPVSEKTIEQMTLKFKQLVQDFDLSDFLINCKKYSYNFILDSEPYQPISKNRRKNIMDFYNAIENEILKQFSTEYNDHYIYQKIKELNKYLARFLEATLNSEVSFLSGWGFVYDELNDAIKSIISLYNDINIFNK